MNKVITSFTDDFAFLSNFYSIEVEFEGKVYPSVEHAYQAAKTRDEMSREEIRKATTPGKAKKLGQKVGMCSDWEHHKLNVMRELLMKKFSNSELREALLATGDVELIEGNSCNDTYWGICFGRGSNHLGKLLMQIRSEVKQ